MDMISTIFLIDRNCEYYFLHNNNYILALNVILADQEEMVITFKLLCPYKSVVTLIIPNKSHDIKELE